MGADYITDRDIEDMLTTTLYKLGRGRFYQIAQELTEYEFMGNILTKRGGVRVVNGGMGIEETLMHSIGGLSKWVGLFDEDTYDFKDLLKKMRVNWTRLTDNMSFERRMTLQNRGESRVNNVIKPQRHAMMLRFAQTLENAFFETPDANNELVMWGLKYWIVKNSVKGFNGGYASGFTRVGNINLTEIPNFKNYTVTYTSVTKSDLIKKLRTMHRATKWKSPVNKKEFRGDTGQRRILYMNEATISSFEDVGEAQNENLGRDVAPYDDEITFKRHPLRFIPKLDEDTSNPVYMIDKATFIPFVLKGDYMRHSDVRRAPLQHNTFVSDVDLSINTICMNRRNNGVAYVV